MIPKGLPRAQRAKNASPAQRGPRRESSAARSSTQLERLARRVREARTLYCVDPCRGGGTLTGRICMCPRDFPARHRTGQELCANLITVRRACSRHPPRRWCPFLLSPSRGEHALARRARLRRSFSPVVHAAGSCANERHSDDMIMSTSHAGAAPSCVIARAYYERTVRRILLVANNASLAGSFITSTTL